MPPPPHPPPRELEHGRVLLRGGDPDVCTQAIPHRLKSPVSFFFKLIPSLILKAHSHTKTETSLLGRNEVDEKDWATNLCCVPF